MKGQEVIRIENLGTHFMGRWVHRGLNLSIKSNRIIAIAGPSGCGKTTLLREILLLQPINEGKIHLLGECISGAHVSEQQIRFFACQMGMMFQQSALFSSLTVLENVMFPFMEYSDFKKETIVELARLKLTLVGFPEEVFYLQPSELSGGMKKRVALARALALDPKILLLDEPSAGLDPKSAYELDQLIRQLQESLKLTVVMVTHDLDTIWGIVDEVIYLGGGKVVAHDTVGKVAARHEPADLNDFFNSPRGQAARQYYEKQEKHHAK